jgi:DNA polymerase-3 subunit gamma/tau
MAKQLARNCAWASRDGAAVRLALDAKARHLLNEERRGAIERALAAQLGEALVVHIEVASEPVASVARQYQQLELERQRAAEAAVATDPAIRALRETFGATVRPGSVQPVNGAGDGAQAKTENRT